MAFFEVGCACEGTLALKLVSLARNRLNFSVSRTQPNHGRFAKLPPYYGWTRNTGENGSRGCCNREKAVKMSAIERETVVKFSSRLTENRHPATWKDTASELFYRSKGHKNQLFQGQKRSKSVCFITDFWPGLNSPALSFHLAGYPTINGFHWW